jgi:gliding motility-associated-like protein
MDIDIIQLDAPVIIGPTSICPNNYNEYYVEMPNQSSIYTWYYNGVVQTQSSKDKIIIRFGNPSLDLISVMEVNSLGCSDSGKLNVKVDHDLDGQVPKLRDDFCVFTKNERYYVVKGISSTYEWELNLGTFLSGQGNHEIFVDWDTVGDGAGSVIEHAYDSVNNAVCISQKNMLPVIIHPKPDTKGIFGDVDLCQMSDLTTGFSVAGFTNSSFNWTFNGDGSKVINQGSNIIKYPLVVSDTFLINVSETSEFGCIGDTLDLELYIRPRPVANTILGDPVICFPYINNKDYLLQGFERSTYEWWIEGGEFVSIDSNKVVVNWFNNKNGKLSVLETSIFGCVGDTIQLDIWIDNPILKLDVITVLPPPLKDDGIQLKWHLINGERYSSAFLIQRREVETNNNFKTVGQVMGDVFEFIDRPINTDSNAFEYRIFGQDLCGNELISDIHTNILLTGEKPEPYSALLKFTDYKGWQNGVSIYQFHRLLVDKTPYEWYYDALESNTAYFGNGLEHFTQCYRMKGTELGGTNETTWSNEVCFDYEPVVFAPNAFTVNNDTKNDVYFVVAGSFKTINLAIYNRWGEKLFETQDISIGWDGTYNGKPVSQGVYIYSLDYTSFDDTPYRQKGTITLLK